MRQCQKCGSSDQWDNADFCDQCGADIADVYCSNPNCPDEGKTKLRQSAAFCPFCGCETYKDED